MSRASAAVRFADGTVRFAVYNGTADIVIPGLFDSSDEAWDADDANSADHMDRRSFPEPVGEVEDAIFYTQYGGGFSFPVRATRNCVIRPTYFDDFIGTMTDGPQGWAEAALHVTPDG